MSTGPYGPPGGEGASQPGDASGYPGYQVPGSYQAPGGAPDYPGGYPQGGYEQGYQAAPGYGGTPPAYPAGYPAPYPTGGYAPNAVTYGAYPTPRNGLGTAALVLGIIGVVLCWIPFTGWVLNILAVIFGAIGRKRAVAGEATNKSTAVAGLVLGVVGLAVWIIILIFWITVFATATSTFQY